MDTVELHPLRAWREAKGITLRELSALLARTTGGEVISSASLSRIEQGQQPPSAGLMRALFHLTHGKVTPNDLVAWWRPRTSQGRRIAA